MEVDGLKEGDEIYCAPIQESLAKSESKRGCLMLKHMQGREYKRVGFCVVDKPNPDWKEDNTRILFQGRPRTGLTGSETAAELKKYAFQFDADTLDPIIII
jgi:hypothetical protein